MLQTCVMDMSPSLAPMIRFYTLAIIINISNEFPRDLLKPSPLLELGLEPGGQPSSPQWGLPGQLSTAQQRPQISGAPHSIQRRNS